MRLDSISVYSCLNSGLDEDGDETSRSYTPISKVSQLGEMDILIKVYYPNERFLKGGVISQYMDKLVIGDRVKISGSKPKYAYKKNGRIAFLDKSLEKTFTKFSMVAGGSGITPVYQFITHMLDEKMNFELSVLFANKTEGDIILRGELEGLQTLSKIRLNFTLDYPDKNWKGFTGFVSDKMFEACFPKAGDDHVLLVCGPPMMVKDARVIANRLGFLEDNIVEF